MHKILLVARREFLETVKTRAFLLGVLFTPVMIIAIIFLTRMMENRAGKEEVPDRTVVVVDHSGQLIEPLRRQFELHSEMFPRQKLILEILDVEGEALERAIADAKEKIRKDEIKGLLVIDRTALSESSACGLYTNRARDMEFYRLIQELTGSAIRSQRARNLGVQEETLQQLTAYVPLEQFDVSSEEGKQVDRMAAMMMPLAFMFMMFMGVFGISQGLLTSVIEEKSSRIMEVLLSGLTSLQLMAGKILGMAGVGVFLMSLWISAGFFTAKNRGLEYLLEVEHPFLFVGYYLLGFLLLASLLAALGSSVNSLKEAQSLMSPLTMVMIIPMVAWFFIVQYPNSIWVTLMSFFPPITPFVMVLRLSGAQVVPAWQIPASLLVLALGALGSVWMAARVFRVGVLMYGKPPTPRELLRWVAIK